MSFWRKLLGVAQPPPALLNWMRLPSLTVIVFGSLDRTPDMLKIQAVYLQWVRVVFPLTEEKYAKDTAGVDAYYLKLVNEKVTFVEVPEVSELGHTDRRSRLLSIYPIGMFWLLLNEGAKINERDAGVVPAVLSEFMRDPRCGMVQGKGHHLFVRPGVIDGTSGTQSLWEIVKAFGLVGKRVDYITIDPRNRRRFEV